MRSDLAEALEDAVDRGLLRYMRAAAGGAARGGRTTFEVRRILKAFVDAQWLGELDARLAAYRAELAGSEEGGAGESEGEGGGKDEGQGGGAERAEA